LRFLAMISSGLAKWDNWGTLRYYSFHAENG